MDPMGLSFDRISIAVGESETDVVATTGTRLMSMLRAVRRGVQWFTNTPITKPPQRAIVEGVSGCVRPGEMLLIIGAAGSGCSSLMKVPCVPWNQRYVCMNLT